MGVLPQNDSSGGTAETADILPDLPEDLRRSVLLITMGILNFLGGLW